MERDDGIQPLSRRRFRQIAEAGCMPNASAMGGSPCGMAGDMTFAFGMPAPSAPRRAAPPARGLLSLIGALAEALPVRHLSVASRPLSRHAARLSGCGDAGRAGFSICPIAIMRVSP